MNCLYLLRGAGSNLQQPQFSNSPIWMFGNQYSSQYEDIMKLKAIINQMNENDNNNNNNNNNSNNNSNNTTTSTPTIPTTNNENIEPYTTNNVNNSNTNNRDNNIISNSNNNNNIENEIQDSNKKNTNDIQDHLFIRQFLEDFTTRVLWFTYRQGFPFIDNTQFDNDCGWGCMLRSGQMLLSNLLLHHALGDEWKKSSNLTHPDVYHNIISMFLDKPSAPFSIHNIAMEGQTLGKNIGEWFAPSIISQAIKALVSKNYDKCNISVFISDDGSLYIDQLLNISLRKKKVSTLNKEQQQQLIKEKEDEENKERIKHKDNSNNNSINNNNSNNNNNNNQNNNDNSINNSEQLLQEIPSSSEEENSKEDFSFESDSSSDEEVEIWEPLLILIPMRLGLDGLNSIYYNSLLEIFKFPQNLGVVGGKPRASLYFIAAQDDNLFYLDPHTVQNHIDNSNSNNNNSSSNSSNNGESSNSLAFSFSSSPSSSNINIINTPTTTTTTTNNNNTSYNRFPLNTFFCGQTKRTHVSEVDPSLVVAFFCKSRCDFEDFVSRAKKMTNQMENPIFSIFDQSPDYFGTNDKEKFSMGEDSEDYGDESDNEDHENSGSGDGDINSGNLNDETSDDIDDYHLIN